LDPEDVFEFFPVRELANEATYAEQSGHFERIMRDTIKADVAWLDYNHEPSSEMCQCAEHPRDYEPYLRCEGVFEEMADYRRRALAGELGPVMQAIARQA
jgi:hypothetical protein